MSESVDHVAKIILIGDSGVGKSCLLERYHQGKFSESSLSTIGVNFIAKTLIFQNKKLRLQLWDTAGQERYRAVSGMYYRFAHVILLLYDSSRRGSFENLDYWLMELNKYYTPDLRPVIILVATKSDLAHLRQVSTNEGQDFANRHEFHFLETSACDNVGIDACFDLACREIISDKTEKLINVQLAEPLDKTITTHFTGRTCCCF